MEEPKSAKLDTPGIDQTSNEADDEFYVDPVKEVKLLAKLDLAFTPIIMLVYLSCFLDRSNIGLSTQIFLMFEIANIILTSRRQCEGSWHAQRHSCHRPAVLNCRLHLLRYLCHVRDASSGFDEETHATRDISHALCCLVADHDFHWFRPEYWRTLCHEIDSWSLRSWTVSLLESVPDDGISKGRAGEESSLSVQLLGFVGRFWRSACLCSSPDGWSFWCGGVEVSLRMFCGHSYRTN